MAKSIQGGSGKTTMLPLGFQRIPNIMGGATPLTFGTSLFKSDCSRAAVACVRGRRRLTESEYESVRSLSTDS
ncbi:unnamed protein product [Phytophthora fragariaefolia]|uniref:Unnamed protein product n=1 Tax=Phytophthora fragariaefolia TaxID=1490495 RepID=A0A9W6XQB6_9STRA|nr:unnamed protein product [Phytophthora fragariaefolia]